MPITPAYPGVYVEEIPSGVRTIAGVSTSDTAFVHFFRQGPVDRAVRLTGLTGFAPGFRRAHPPHGARYATRR